ncbi:MAG: hypothetical protein WAM28_01955 [Chlamydiales bacterium]
MTKNISSTELTEQIDLFRQLLVSSWPHLDNLMEHHDWDHDMDLILDWIQVNWELLVERELLGKGNYLTPMSVPLSMRVINNNIAPNFSVVTQVSRDILDLKTGKTLPKNCTLRFCGFCSAQEKGFGLYPPFDLASLVLDSTKELFIVPFSNLEFCLIKLS